MADQAALQDAPSEGSVRDKLFDLLMRRFDLFQAHRDGVKAVLRSLPADPPLALLAGIATKRSMRWMLQAAGVDATGLRGEIQIRGLLAVWLWAVRAWEKDEFGRPVRHHGGGRFGRCSALKTPPTGLAPAARRRLCRRSTPGPGNSIRRTCRRRTTRRSTLGATAFDWCSYLRSVRLTAALEARLETARRLADEAASRAMAMRPPPGSGHAALKGPPGLGYRGGYDDRAVPV